MSDNKKKTDFLKIISCAASSAALVFLIWLYKEPRFSNISSVFLVTGVFAFAAEAGVLFLLKNRRVLVKILKIIIVYVLNACIIIGAAIYSFAPAIILQPHTDEKAHEELSLIENVKELTFEGSNGNINGWFYNNAGENAPTILYFYGNYETASTALLSFIKKDGGEFIGNCNFAVFDYPAYGKSDGKCSDDSLLSFSLDVYDFLSETTDNIITFGYSVGTGPAVYLAANRDVSGLLLFAPYADGYDLYNNIINIFRGPLKYLVAFNIESIKYAENVSEKTMIIASSDDELIDISTSLRLSQAFYDCNFVKVNGIGHNGFRNSDKVMSAAAAFIKEVSL